MNHGKYVFSQVIEIVPPHQFQKCVDRYCGQYRIKQLTCWEQFLAMTFGQLAYRESLRDVTTCLKAQQSKLYHLGFRSAVMLPTLAQANKRRDWRIYRDFAYILITEARKLYIDDNIFNLDLDGTYYVLDSTSIDLCLSVFNWARYKSKLGAVKVHTQMDLRGSIPTFFHITDGKVNDMNFLDLIDYEVGAYYIMDRGYIDYARLYKINQAGAFFITRAVRNTVLERIYSNAVDRSNGLRCDQIIRLTSKQGRGRYPTKLRRIKYYDKETKHYYVFLTNNFNISAQTVADLYRHRWQIELFFKWIKQHLKIKTFWGQSENAVKTQICIAICTYVIVAILKKKLHMERSLYEMLQILSVSLFDKTPLVELFSTDLLQSFEDEYQSTLPLGGF
jgi:transposase